MIFGGLGGIIADRYLFPYLSATKMFSQYSFLKKGREDITVINKTEQITIKEETSISKIANQVSSSVVNIISHPNKEAKNTSAKKSVPGSNVKNGTGVIVTGDGMIMTYASAINLENSRYKIMTYDSNVYDAEFLGLDAYSNLAFLKINASNLPVASFGDSDTIKAGEKIVAVANSYGSYANRYATGLISDFNPKYNLAGLSLSSSEKLEGVFETDFNDKQYFVGGPVVDYSGQVAGIVGVVEKDNLPSYFLIPSKKVQNIVNRAVKKELNETPSLGVYYVSLDKSYALENDLNVEVGALIYSASGQNGLAVIANSPAQKAGLKIGDIIVSMDGEQISAENSLADLLYRHKKGEQINLKVLRDGKEIKISVQL